MPFDINTAIPVKEAETGLEIGGQFDINTAKPVSPEDNVPSLQALTPEIKERYPLEWIPDAETKQLQTFTDQIYRAATGIEPEKAIKAEKDLTNLMSRGPRVAFAFAAPLYALGFEALQQAKNAVVPIFTKEKDKYSPLETRLLTELLPEKLPTPFKIGASIAEWLGEVALMGALADVTKRGLLENTIKELGGKLTKAGYGEGKITVTREAIKEAVKGTSLEQEAERYLKTRNIKIEPNARLDYAQMQKDIVPVTSGAEIKPPIPGVPAVAGKPLTLAIKLNSGEVVSDNTAKLHSDIITNKNIEPDKVTDVGFIDNEGKYIAVKKPDSQGGEIIQENLPEVPKELLDKVKGLVSDKIKITPERIKPDVSGVAPLQRQIQAMEERKARVETAQDALEEMNTVREYFKGRITKYKGEYLKEELAEIPKYYITKEGGLKPDEAMDELRNQFNIEITDEGELKEYLKNLEQSRKDLLAEIKANKPELITKRETTLLNQRIKATEQGLKEGRIQTKKEVEAIQTELVQAIEDAKLPLEERAKFLRTIKNIQTKEDLAREFPKVAERLQEMKEKQSREELVGEIKKISDRTKASQVIAVEYAGLIQDVVDRFELQGHRPETTEELQKTKEYIQQAIREGKEIDMPKDVLEKLEILERKPLKEITSQELEDLRDSIEELESLGKTKLRLRQIGYERRKAQDLIKLKADSRPINLKEKIKGNIGERLNFVQNIQNWLINKINAKMEKSIVLTPMDAVIDELDGEKNYKGANYTIYKKTIDEGWGQYNKLRHDFTDKAEKLSEGLDEGNFERIVAYATLQQEGGLDKLEALGYAKEEIAKIKLSPQEKALLDEMHKQFESSFPQIAETLRLTYNKPIKKVKFYFPFMTDFGAMTDFEIRDRFGDVPEYRKALRKNPEMGFAKERVGGKQKINLNALEVFTRHMDNVAYLITVGKDIKYLNDLAATPEYREAVGDLGQEIMREWLDLIARKGRMAGERVPLLDTLRRYAGGANLAFKLSSALIQPTSLFDGAALIGNYAFEGTQMIIYKKIRTFLMDNFTEIRARVGDDPAYLDFYQKDGIVDKAIEIGLYPLQQLDKLTASSVAIGAYKKFCVENGIEFDLSKPNKDAIAYAQTILRRTQSSALFKDVALSLSKGKLSGNLSVDKALLQFQSFLLNRWSLITHDLYKAGIQGKNKKQALNIAFWLIMATIAETLIRRGIRMAFEDEQRKEREKNLGQDLALNVLQNIPFMGNIISLIFYGQSGVPAVDWVTGIGGSISSAVKSKTEEARNRNLLRAGVSALPGGAQIKQILPKKEEKKGLSRGKELKH